MEDHVSRFFIDVQSALSRLVVVSGMEARLIDLVCGLDVSYRGEVGVAAAVLWSLKDGSMVNISLYRGRVFFSYVPGLLYLREAPLMLAALRGLSKSPELLLVDGHGLAHPRRAGLASIVGLLSDTPSIGVAKSLLHGQIVSSEGSTYIVVEGERVGLVYRSRVGRRIYLSVGHRTDLELLKTLLGIFGDELLSPLTRAHKESKRAASAN